MKTKRLNLRPLTIQDKQDIFEHIAHDSQVVQTFLIKYAETIDEFHYDHLLEYLEKNASFYYAIELLEKKECIGMIFENDHKENESEIGYALSSKYWNQGYMSEALEAVIQDLKKQKGITISAGAFKENIGSIRVMEKCGMVYSHTIENELEWLGKKHDVVYYKVKND